MSSVKSFLKQKTAGKQVDMEECLPVSTNVYCSVFGAQCHVVCLVIDRQTRKDVCPVRIIFRRRSFHRLQPTDRCLSVAYSQWLKAQVDNDASLKPTSQVRYVELGTGS